MGEKEEKMNLKLSNAFGTADYDKSVTMMTSVELDTIKKREENERWWNMAHTQFLCADNDERKFFPIKKKSNCSPSYRPHSPCRSKRCMHTKLKPKSVWQYQEKYCRHFVGVRAAQDTVKLSYHSNFSLSVRPTSVKSQFVTKLKTPEREFHAWQQCRALHAYTLYWFFVSSSAQATMKNFVGCQCENFHVFV